MAGVTSLSPAPCSHSRAGQACARTAHTPRGLLDFWRGRESVQDLNHQKSQQICNPSSSSSVLADVSKIQIGFNSPDNFVLFRSPGVGLKTKIILAWGILVCRMRYERGEHLGGLLQLRGNVNQTSTSLACRILRLLLSYAVQDLDQGLGSRKGLP